VQSQLRNLLKNIKEKADEIILGGIIMRLVTINHVKPGMILAKPIYHHDDGKVLLFDNVELKKSYIQRLKELNYTHIYIKDPDDPSERVEFLEPVKQETKIKATIILKNTLIAYNQTHKPDLDKLQGVVAEMIDQIIDNQDVFYNLIDIRSYDNYTYAHSVNVCVLSLMVGSLLRLKRNELEILGVGAILHDIGKIFVENEILNKPGNLNMQEFEIIKTHTSKGYEFLQGKFSISYIAAHIAWEHHERMDGSGYPRGLTETQIHRFAKIVAVTDVYDAMTAERVYREALPSFMVMDELRAGINIKYDRLIVEALSKVVAPYYVGSTLRLSNGEEILVTRVSKTECWVKALNGPRQGTIYDLYRYPELKVIPPEKSKA
jgi:HD-GYP domain-containing protein (c-di-GMP phosphodiesterase class II)